MPTATLILTDQIAAASAAAQEPRQRVDRLTAELSEAIATGQFERASHLRRELEAARGEQVVADAAVAALQAGAKAIEEERAATDRQIQIATQRAQAERDLADAHAAEQHGLAELDAAVESMFDCLARAQQEFRRAQALEFSVGAARDRANVARDRASETPTGLMHKAVKPNKASILAEHDPLISQLARWSR